MKVVIIILLLVAVSFVAVMVYGVTRDEPPPATAQRGDCGKPPPKVDPDDPDTDLLEDWCPPNFGSVVTKLRARFGPKAEVDEPEVAVANLQPAIRTVRPDDREFRVARIALVAGRGALIRSQRIDGRDGRVCVCKAGEAVERADFAGCSSAWLDNQAADRCREGSEATLVFGPAGGTLTFESLRPARLVVNPADQDAED